MRASNVSTVVEFGARMLVWCYFQSLWEVRRTAKYNAEIRDLVKVIACAMQG